MVAPTVERKSDRWQRLQRWGLLAFTTLALLLLGLRARRILVAAGLTLGSMSWLAVLALPAFALWTLAAAAAWRSRIAETGARPIPSLARLWLIRVQAQALNLVLPLAGLGGEALRASALGQRTRQGPASAASVASDVIVEIVACFAFVLVGTLLGWHAIRLGGGLRVVFVLTSAAVVLGLSFVPTYLARLGPGKASGRGRFARWVAGWLSPMLADMNHGQTAGWWRCLAWHVVERVLIAAETWIYAWALGFRLSIVGAVVATAAMTIIGSLLFFIPGQAVAADGGLALGLQWLGAPWSMGVAVAFARRLRQLLVGVLGLCLLGGALIRQRGTHAEEPPAVRTPEGGM